MADDYLKQLLSRDEVVLIDARQHWMAAIRFALKPILLIGGVILLLILNNIFQFDGFLSFINDVVALLLVIGIIVAVIWLPVDLVRWRSRKYVLTNRRVMRLDGVINKNSFDSSLEKINDIESNQPLVGRLLGYTNLTIYTASDQANEQYNQLIDGLQFKKAVLDAKEGIRALAPLTALPEGFVVRGGTNEASMRADGKLQPEPQPRARARARARGACSPSVCTSRDRAGACT